MVTAKRGRPHTGNEDEDGFLYHYTDLEACTNIIRSKSLRATQIRCLNDSSEQKIMRRLVLQQISKRESELQGEGTVRLDGHRGLLQRSAEVFVTCFTEDRGDRLSQWRGYGGSAGVSLRFKKQQLQEYFQPSHDLTLAALYRINYVSSDGDRETNQMIDQVLDCYDGTDRNPWQWFEEEVLAHGAALKHISFVEEKEWRIVMYQGDKTIKHRVRGGLLVPYIEINFEEDFKTLLAGVRVGPHLHQKQNAVTLKSLLAEQCFESTKVSCSQTPYRGF